jgi:hypothetical protein
MSPDVVVVGSLGLHPEPLQLRKSLATWEEDSMSRILMPFGVLIVVLACAIVGGCGSASGDDDNGGSGDDGGDDAGGDDTDGLPESCNTNTPPEVYSVGVLVNGEHRDEPVVISADEKLEFEIEYYDADCNLEGGTLQIWSDQGVMGFDGAVNHGIGCSSQDDGKPYRKEVDGDLLVFVTNIRIGLQDTCEEISSLIPVDITVHY